MSETTMQETTSETVTPKAPASPKTPTPRKPDMNGMGEALRKADMTGALEKARKESADYRQRLHAITEERDRIGAQLAHIRRAMLMTRPEFAKLQPTAITDALDMMDDEHVAALFTDDGEPDGDAIAAQVETIITERPYMAKPKPVSDPLARKTLDLAENPQGAFRTKRNDLRSALHR
ncbi:hypothetical protein [Bifidobacterium saguinibicoloris]|uniref:hypothetical protein n=1 Tax=Bifidobacterium saguinibicoloris TaxID=2834433 RepID=UPI001C567B23|nr:hypothetical protein [Bifidobacterium saguinibicoloris]MBW3081769.1 hypothetical protein [Bifidobacterium saguinibicoloris]